MVIFLGYVARFVGYAMPFVTAYFAAKGKPELAAAVGTVGAAVLHGTAPTVFPKKG